MNLTCPLAFQRPRRPYEPNILALSHHVIFSLVLHSVAWSTFKCRTKRAPLLVTRERATEHSHPSDLPVLRPPSFSSSPSDLQAVLAPFFFFPFFPLPSSSTLRHLRHGVAIMNFEKQYGVTPPLSTEMPTEEQRRATDALLEELRQQGTFESTAETQKR